MSKVAAILIFISIELTLSIAAPVFAQEAYLLGGLITNNEDHDQSYSWELLYKEDLCRYASLSFGWLNEGHFTGHHRDGQTLQVWVNTDVWRNRWSLAAGVGPYLSFDTEESGLRGDKDAHGWGAVASLSAIYHTQSPWLFQVEANHVWERGNFDTNSLLIGMGYRFNSGDLSTPMPDEPVLDERPTKNEITILHGRTVLNSFNANTAESTEVEYRRRIHRHLDWTLGWIYEGDVEISRRNGVASQIWPARSFFDNRLSLGLGLGVYAALEEGNSEDSGGGGEAYLTGLLTVTASYDISQRFLARLSVNRTITNYDRDTDILLAGLGYRF